MIHETVKVRQDLNDSCRRQGAEIVDVGRAGRQGRMMKNKSPRMISEITAFCFAAYMFTIYPLFFQDNYIDIQHAKFRAYTAAAVAFLAITAVAELIYFLKSRKTVITADKQNRQGSVRYDRLLLIFSALFAAAIIIGTLMSPWKSDALTGAVARQMGLISWLLCIGTVLVLSRTGSFINTLNPVSMESPDPAVSLVSDPALAGGSKNSRNSAKVGGSKNSRNTSKSKASKNSRNSAKAGSYENSRNSTQAGGLKATLALVLIYVFAAGSGIVSFIAILNFWGVDPFGMYKNLVEAQHSYFITTTGNINVCAGYLCVIVPVLLCCFYFSRKKTNRILFGIISAIAIYAGFMASSDSFLIGCFGAFLVLLWLSLNGPDWMKKFWNVCVLFYLCTLLVKLTLVAGRASTSIFYAVYPDDGVIGIALSPLFLICGGVVLAALIVFERMILAKKAESHSVPDSKHDSKKNSKKSSNRTDALQSEQYSKVNREIDMDCGINVYHKIRKWLFIVFGLLLAVFIILLIVANTGHATNSLLKKLVITREFGSYRGYIWKRSLDVFSSLSFPEKLFGCAPDCFYYAIMPLYGTEMTSMYNMVFTDAHCEFLHMLVTTGIVGTIGYFGLQITVLISCLRRFRKSFVAFSGAVLVGSYLLQGIVNNPQIAITPILFVLLGFAMAKDY